MIIDWQGCGFDLVSNDLMWCLYGFIKVSLSFPAMSLLLFMVFNEEAANRVATGNTIREEVSWLGRQFFYAVVYLH
jgi:hypothetical protein